MKIPRLVIAGTHSGVGKTTITTGLMQLLSNIGYQVQGFKVGPDYIDPSYHTLATKRISRNLDTWLLDEEKVMELFTGNCGTAKIAIIEGVMGLFDGFRGNSLLGSTAHIAKITKTPVILVVDTKSQGQSVAAVVYGFKNLDSEINLAGVILNNIASPRHLEIITDALDSLKIPIIGHLFRDSAIDIPERHLGLIPAFEKDEIGKNIQKIAAKLKDSIHIEKLIQIAQKAPPISFKANTIFNSEDQGQFPSLKIGYAFDKAFSFYYQDSLDLLEHLGAELIPFSPLEDSTIPKELAGILIGGGFPELFLEELTSNLEFMNSLKNAYSSGLPIYAECGGFMYLTTGINNKEKKCFKMADIIPGSCTIHKKLVGMGYREGTIINDSILGDQNTPIRGHVFHYSSFKPVATINAKRAFSFTSGNYEGYLDENILASYLHLHFASNPNLAKSFLAKCSPKI